jgi:post-segregation antitoxin (ccd killing protein)
MISMPRRRALISDPLDVIASAPGRAAKAVSKYAPTAKYPLRVPTDLLEKARDVAYWERMGVSELAETGLRREIERLEKKRGKPYPRREREHKTGPKPRR